MRKGRLARLARLGGMAAGLATDAVGAGGALVTSGANAAARKVHEKAARRMLAVFGDMKGLPLKAGQMLSYIDEFIPDEHRHIYEETLGKLQRETPPMPWQAIEAVFVEDFGRPADELFAHFDREPIAAASIGQVYAATTHDGRDVVVKVQYPDVVDALNSDLANIGVLTSAMTTILPGMDVQSIIDDVTTRLLDECDYGAELRNQRAFREVWLGDPGVNVPEPVDELCSDRVLTSERVRGAWTWQQMLAEASDEQKSAYGNIIFRFVFGSLFEHGMFNADPHPGNYLFHPDGAVSFIDYGSVAIFGADQRAAFQELRRGVLRGDSGPAFEAELRTAFGMPDDLDPEVYARVETYLRRVFEPVTEPQPYRWTRDYSKELLKQTLLLKNEMSMKLIRGRKAYPLDPAKSDGGIAFLGRIVFGLGSILATLRTEGDFRGVVEEMGGMGSDH